MTALWDELKKNIKVWGNVAAEKAEEIGKVAATKTEELTKISKIKLEIHQLNRDLEKNYADLGKYVFDATNENVTNFAGNEQFLNYVNKAQDLLAKIQQKEDRIKSIKEEYGKTGAAEEEESSEESSESSEKK